MALFKITIVTIGLLSFYFGLEFIHKHARLESWITRKVAHIFSALIAVPLLYFLSYSEYLAVLVFFIIFFVIATHKKVFKSIHLQGSTTIGEVFFPIGILFVIIAAYQNHFIAISSFLVLGIADAFAGIVGRQYSLNKKTLAGSLAFLITTVLILAATYWGFNVMFTGLSIISIVAISLVATLTEHISLFGSDNLTVPIVVVLLMFLLF